MTRRRMWVLLGAVGSLLVIALVVVLIVWRGGAGVPEAEAASRPQPSSSPAPLAVTATPQPAVEPAANGPHPSQCEQLYSPAMVAAFGDLALNPAWVAEENSGVNRGSADPELVTLIDAAGEKLTCVWANAGGASGVGLTTELVWVTPEQSAAVLSRLSAAGMNCYEELGGMRCIVEAEGDGGVFGESHFVREGIWLATHYFNTGPDGYTHDMIANVWAGA